MKITSILIIHITVLKVLESVNVCSRDTLLIVTIVILLSILSVFVFFDESLQFLIDFRIDMFDSTSKGFREIETKDWWISVDVVLFNMMGCTLFKPHWTNWYLILHVKCELKWMNEWMCWINVKQVLDT